MNINLINLFNNTQTCESNIEELNTIGEGAFQNILDNILNSSGTFEEKCTLSTEYLPNEDVDELDCEKIEILENNTLIICTPQTNTNGLKVNTEDKTLNNNLEITTVSNSKITQSGKEILDDVKYILSEEVTSSNNDFDIETNNLIDNDESDFNIEMNKAIDIIESNINEDNFFKNNEQDFQNTEELLEGDINDLNILETTKTTLEEEIRELVQDDAKASDILEQFKEGLQNTSTPKHIQIILKPRSLGTLNVNIKFINQSMHVDIYVDNDDIQKILSKNLSEIEYLLNPDSSINIDNINIIRKQDKSIKENYNYRRELLLNKINHNSRVLKTKPIFFM